MKLVVLAGALDLKHPLGCTPALWQFLKALHECDVDVIATPYYGRTIESLWWRSYDNPRYKLSTAYSTLTGFPRRSRTAVSTGSFVRALELQLTRTLIRPRWLKHLSSILEEEEAVSALLIMTAPPNHLAGIATEVRERFGIPVCYYDTDLPTSLPAYGGFDSGHDRYRGANIAEFDLVLSNSQGALRDLSVMGARRADVLWFGADPDVFRPRQTDKDIDVFFYGHGIEHRQDYLRELISIPSERLTQRRFVVAGLNLDMHLGRAFRLGAISPSEIRSCIARSRIQVNVPRSPHANVYASANTRLFELAAMEEAIVSRPINGIEEWFRPGVELEIVSSASEAIDVYESLIDDPVRRQSLAEAARRRVLQDHTFRNRAERFIQLLRSVRVADRRPA